MSDQSGNTQREEMTQEDYLIERHELYLQAVTESGLPLWVCDMYADQLLWYEEVESPQPVKDTSQVESGLPF